MGQEIETRLSEIRTRFLTGNLLSPKDAANRADVSFLLIRLLSTEKEAVRLLGILQQKIHGETRDEQRRLEQIRERASEIAVHEEMVGPLKARTPKDERRLH
jgi:hypothetical protein